MDVEVFGDDAPLPVPSEDSIQRPLYDQPEENNFIQSKAPATKREADKSSDPQMIKKVGPSTIIKINSNKSPVQQLNEIRHGVQYILASQTGPIHAPIFTMQVVIDGKTYEGIGHNKKASKLQCAQTALDALIELSKQGINVKQTRKMYRNETSRKNKNKDSQVSTSIEEKPVSEPYNDHINNDFSLNSSKPIESESVKNQSIEIKNPAAILNEIRKDLNYSIVGEMGLPPSRFYKIAVNVDGLTFEGIGNSKKIAKARAAQTALTSLWNLKFKEAVDDSSYPELVTTDEAFSDVNLPPDVVKRLKTPIMKITVGESIGHGSVSSVTEAKTDAQILYEHFGPAFGSQINITYQPFSGNGKNFGNATMCIATVEGKNYEGVGKNKADAKKKALQFACDSLKQSGEWFRRAHRAKEERKARRDSMKKKNFTKGRFKKRHGLGFRDDKGETSYASYFQTKDKTRNELNPYNTGNQSAAFSYGYN